MSSSEFLLLGHIVFAILWLGAGFSLVVLGLLGEWRSDVGSMRTALDGANRLGTNSLLDILVFGRRAGKRMAADLAALPEPEPDLGAEASVQAEKDQGESLGVTGTPSIFVDGVRVTDWRNYSAVKAMIDAALAARG